MRRTMVLVMVLVMCIWCASAAGASGVCPESKRRYPGDCRLFYRCVLLPVPAATTATRTPGVAHAHVWVPTRCTAGLVFEPMLKQCVFPDPDWDCRNDDQLIPVLKYPATSEVPQQPEDITEDEHLVTDKMDELNLIIPHVFEIASNADRIDEESEMITDNIDRPIVSSTSRPSLSSYQSAMTRGPYIPVTDVNGPSVDQIATQMDRIADLVHSLKAVAHTEAPSVLRRKAPQRQNSKPKPFTTVTESVALPVTVSHSQIPSPGGVNVIINPPVAHAHFATEPHYQLNLLPIQLNKITEQPSLPLTAQQHETNLNFFGSSVLKHIVEQSAHRVPAATIDQQNTERLVSALFNKYLANKSFVKKNVSSASHPMYAPVYQIPEQPDPGPVSLRIKHGSIAAVSVPAPCVTGVRLPNATDCRRYYMCNASTSAMHTYTCPPYTAFDKVRRMCDVTQYARCVNPSGTESEQGDLLRVQLPPDEACDTRDKLPDPTSPRRYVLCVRSYDGRWTRHQMTCPGLLIYCPTRNFCSPKSSCY